MENKISNKFSFGQNPKKASDFDFSRKGFIDLTFKEESKLEQLQQYQVTLRKNVRDENFRIKRSEKITDEEKSTASLSFKEQEVKVKQAVECINQSDDFDALLESTIEIRKAITLKSEVLVSIILGNKYLGFVMKVLSMDPNNRIAYECLWSIGNLVCISDKIGVLLIQLGFHLKIYEILNCEGVDTRIVSQAISGIRNMAQIRLFFEEICSDTLEILNEEHCIESQTFVTNKIGPSEFIDGINKAFDASSETQHKVICLICIFQMSKSIKPLNASIGQKVIQFIQNVFNSSNESQVICSCYNVIINYIKVHQMFCDEIMKYPIFHGNSDKSQLKDYILKFDISDIKVLNKKMEFVQFLVINGKLSFNAIRMIGDELSKVSLENFEFVSQPALTIIALVTQKSFDNREVSQKLYQSISLKKLLPLVLQQRSIINCVQNTMIIVLNIFKSNSVELISELYRNRAVDVCGDALMIRDQKTIHLSIKTLSCLISYGEQADQKIDELESRGYSQEDIVYSKWCPYLVIPSRGDIIRTIIMRSGDTVHDLEYHPFEIIQKLASDLCRLIDAEREEQFKQSFQ